MGRGPATTITSKGVRCRTSSRHIHHKPPTSPSKMKLTKENLQSHDMPASVSTSASTLLSPVDEIEHWKGWIAALLEALVYNGIHGRAVLNEAPVYIHDGSVIYRGDKKFENTPEFWERQYKRLKDLKAALDGPCKPPIIDAEGQAKQDKEDDHFKYRERVDMWEVSPNGPASPGLQTLHTHPLSPTPTGSSPDQNSSTCERGSRKRPLDTIDLPEARKRQRTNNTPRHIGGPQDTVEPRAFNRPSSHCEHGARKRQRQTMEPAVSNKRQRRNSPTAHSHGLQKGIYQRQAKKRHENMLDRTQSKSQVETQQSKHQSIADSSERQSQRVYLPTSKTDTAHSETTGSKQIGVPGVSAKGVKPLRRSERLAAQRR